MGGGRFECATAVALGGPSQRKDLRFGLLGRLAGSWSGAKLVGIDRAGSDLLEPPWPDGGEVADRFDAVVTPGWKPPHTPESGPGEIGRPSPDEPTLLGRVKDVASLVRDRLGYPEELRSRA